MTEPVKAMSPASVGIRDIPRVLYTPRAVFRRVEDVPAWGWPLVVLLTVVTLIGYAKVQTGLIDRDVDLQVRERIAQIDSTQRNVVERSELREMYEQEYKMGEFLKLLTRIQVIVAEPARALAVALLMAAALYGAVALTGRKPEWHTLLTICVFAGFVDALRLLVVLGLTLCFRAQDVDTSPALLTRLMIPEQGMDPVQARNLVALSSLLAALDPFRIWYWLVVIIGLRATRQLRGWQVWVTCLACWLVSAGGRCGLAVLLAPGAAGGGMSAA